MPFEFHVYYKLINDCCQTTVNDPNNPNANPIEPGYFSAFPAGFRKVVRQTKNVQGWTKKWASGLAISLVLLPTTSD